MLPTTADLGAGGASKSQVATKSKDRGARRYMRKRLRIVCAYWLATYCIRNMTADEASNAPDTSEKIKPLCCSATRVGSSNTLKQINVPPIAIIM